MGSDSSNIDNKKSLIENGWVQQYLPQYGSKVYTKPGEEKVYQVINFFSDQQFTKLLAKRLQFNHPNLITVQSVSYQVNDHDSSQDICSQDHMKTGQLTYKLITYNLEQQIQGYCKLKKCIPQVQIVRIFYAVVDCLKYLHSNNTCHGDVKPSNIFFKSNKEICLIDSYFVNRGKTAYEIVLENPRAMSFLSPQQLELLKYKMYDCLDSSNKNEMFAVGLSMIEATTIQSGMECYDLQKLEIKQSFLANKLNQIIEFGYSLQLANLIISCVNKNRKKRPSFQSFLHSLANISSQLNKKERNF